MININEELTKDGYVLKSDIKKNYEKAKENKIFNNLVEKLKMPDETLMKYTTQLEECSINYETCKKCKGLINCPYKIQGYSYLPKITDKNITFNYQPCNYLIKNKKAQDYKKNIYLFDIPAEIKEADFKNIYLTDGARFEVIEWINTFPNKYMKDKKQKGLYLYGNFGCGKTYLISALFNEMAKKGIKSAIVFWPEILRDLKSSFGIDFKEKYQFIKKVPLLLIDDIGAENTTAWSRDEILCPLIQYRMQEHLPTFFTSNLDLKSLTEHFSVTKESIDAVKSGRIIERIKQLTETKEMISKNLRS
ncbi:MAG: primosomal protein DnaI [Bacilli bacterium]|nr:primosomal protein DnaI [Bacilli bacterium]